MSRVEKILLYVPVEEAEEAQSAGARHDPGCKCWYIEPDQERPRFRRWLRRGLEAEAFTILSDEAYVAVARTPCWRCGTPTEVVCIYCISGEVNGEPCREFTVSNVTAIEPSLRRQLSQWPTFHVAHHHSPGQRYFANHCEHCGACQDDDSLHGEPGAVFFAPRHLPPNALHLVPVKGQARLSGDEGFEPG